MLENEKKIAVQKYVEAMSKKAGIEYKYTQEDGTDWVGIVVDISRYDKNSKNYDEEYFNKIYSKPKGFFQSRTWKLGEFINTMKRLLSIGDNNNIRIWFDFKNYNYLNKVSDDIKDAIKKTKFPQTQFRFETEFDEPSIKMRFGNFPAMDRNRFSEFIDELNQLVDYDLDVYRWSYGTGPLSED
jgi:hypothetical protein